MWHRFAYDSSIQIAAPDSLVFCVCVRMEFIVGLELPRHRHISVAIRLVQPRCTRVREFSFIHSHNGWTLPLAGPQHLNLCIPGHDDDVDDDHSSILTRRRCIYLCARSCQHTRIVQSSLTLWHCSARVHNTHMIRDRVHYSCTFIHAYNITGSATVVGRAQSRVCLQYKSANILLRHPGRCRRRHSCPSHIGRPAPHRTNAMSASEYIKAPIRCTRVWRIKHLRIWNSVSLQRTWRCCIVRWCVCVSSMGHPFPVDSRHYRLTGNNNIYNLIKYSKYPICVFIVLCYH